MLIILPGLSPNPMDILKPGLITEAIMKKTGSKKNLPKLSEIESFRAQK
jgi:hypothetical protein